MKKKKLITLSASALIIFVINFSGCTGVNGNPTELTGTWKCKTSTTDESGDKTERKYEFVFDESGTIHYEIETDEKFAGGDLIEITVDGNFYGDPSNSPKTITIVMEDTERKTNGVATQGDESGTAVSGTYSIQYTTPNRLFLYIPSLLGSQTVTLLKQ